MASFSNIVGAFAARKGVPPQPQHASPRLSDTARQLSHHLLTTHSSGKPLVAEIPRFTLKRLFRPVAWAMPANVERWLNQTIDLAMKGLPAKIVLEMSKFPTIDHALASEHRTTELNLKRDYAQMAATQATYHLVHAVDTAFNKDWGPSARKFANQKINALAQNFILSKLDKMLSLDELDSIANSLSKVSFNAPEQSINQKELFVLYQLTDALIGQVLKQNKLDASPDDKFCIEEINQILSDVPKSELRQTYLKMCDALETGLRDFFTDYNKVVKGDRHQFSRLFETGSSSQDAPQAHQWLEQQKVKFQAVMDQALVGLTVETRGALLATIVAPHLQKLGDPSTALARNLPAIQSAFAKIEADRQQNEQSAGLGMPFSDRKWLIQSGLEGLKDSLTQYGMGDIREAYGDNRSGHATKDSGMQRHIARVAGPEMLGDLAPMHRAAVLSALADYGQGVTAFLRDKGISISTIPSGTGMAELTQRSFEEVSKGNFLHDAVKPKFYASRKAAERIFQVSAIADLISYEPGSVGTPHFNTKLKAVKMSSLYASAGENAAAHEIGHAIDLSISKIGRNYFSTVQSAMRAEYRQAAHGQDGVTAYAQSHVLEYFAESAAAFLNQHGVGSSYADWGGNNDLFSRDNLKDRHPVIERFLDEFLRNPYKPERAEYQANKQAKNSGRFKK